VHRDAKHRGHHLDGAHTAVVHIAVVMVMTEGEDADLPRLRLRPCSGDHIAGPALIHPSIPSAAAN